MIKSFEFKPYEGIGELKLGSSRDEIKNILNKYQLNYKEADIRVEHQGHLTICVGYNMFIHFDQNDSVNFIELGMDQNTTEADFDIIFENKRLFKQNHFELYKILKKNDEDLVEEATGLTSFKLGIGTWCGLGYFEEPLLHPESIFVFTKGYYDDI
ncbi:hypothetical protein AAEX28_01695 [Lentisphaerota bacterium WC36G]|nr:hypothetical protein LJT99_04580 [Lentisphaerae bacterium WC36]